MREKTYGWYPPAHDIYTNRGPYNKYQLECLYKFRDTMYESKPIAPPTPTLMVRGYSPAPPGSRPSTAVQHSTGKTTTAHRAKSAPVPKFKLIPKLSIPTPSQCWATKLPETEYTAAPPTHNPLESRAPSTASTQVSWPSPHITKLEAPKATTHEGVPSTQEQNLRRDRIKSASIHRQKTPVPVRPVKSAGPARSPQPPVVTVPGVSPCVTPVPSQPEVGTSPVSRPINPVPAGQDLEDDLEIQEDEGDEWEIAREKHGWMAEVHGNPYGYKKITKRLPYTLKCVEPQLAPDPPDPHMENMETFFYNTIPRRPMAYTVHKEWISEVLHAKRLELQKKQGIKYRWKNFGFVY